MRNLFLAALVVVSFSCGHNYPGLVDSDLPEDETVLEEADPTETVVVVDLEDGGSVFEDGGVVDEGDAGTVAIEDAGTPVETDAGLELADAGSPEVDAGSPAPFDGGSVKPGKGRGPFCKHNGHSHGLGSKWCR